MKEAGAGVAVRQAEAGADRVPGRVVRLRMEGCCPAGLVEGVSRGGDRAQRGEGCVGGEGVEALQGMRTWHRRPEPMVRTPEPGGRSAGGGDVGAREVSVSKAA